jgi:hypothetical protein
MVPEAAGKKHSRADEKIKITAVDASEQTRRVQEVVARRAYEIFEGRGSASGHDVEDWRQAESELVRPCFSGRMSVDSTLWIGTDVAVFDEDTIEIWVAPHQLTICGKPRAEKKVAAATTEGSGSYPHGEIAFHVCNPTCEIDPSKVTAKINGASLEIFLRKANAKREVKVAGA